MLGISVAAEQLLASQGHSPMGLVCLLVICSVITLILYSNAVFSVMFSSERRDMGT
jgi:hypothetical protein